MYCILQICIRSCFSLVSRIKLKHICLGVIFFLLLDFFGAFTHMFEKSYDENFIYPYNGNVHEFVSALRHRKKPSIEPINRYNYSYILNEKKKCIDPGFSEFRVVFIVKSAAQNFDRRLGIRSSWGYEKRFFDVPTRTVFVLGTRTDDEEIRTRIKAEASKYKDIIQADFVDSYYNNTIKTMMGFQWAVEYCSNSKFYMFVDDDIYVSVKNVLRFIRNPVNYPDYFKEPRKIEIRKREIKLSDFPSPFKMSHIVTEDQFNTINKTNKPVSYDLGQQLYLTLKENKTKIKNAKSKSVIVEDKLQNTVLMQNRTKRQVFDIELPSDIKFFAGYVFRSSPHRHKSSKWYVSLQEYPYNLWPPYVTAGAYILSKEALLEMYYTSFYTKHFKFDDIFLGLVAKKADIEPFHCEEFHFYKKDYTKFNYKYVVTSHGYEDPNELLRVWNEQKALGNA